MFAITEKTTDLGAITEVNKILPEAQKWHERQVNVHNGVVTKEDLEGAIKARDALANSDALKFCRTFSSRAALDPQKYAASKARVDATILKADQAIKALNEKYGLDGNKILNFIKSMVTTLFFVKFTEITMPIAKNIAVTVAETASNAARAAMNSLPAVSSLTPHTLVMGTGVAIAACLVAQRLTQNESYIC